MPSILDHSPVSPILRFSTVYKTYSSSPIFLFKVTSESLVSISQPSIVDTLFTSSFFSLTISSFIKFTSSWSAVTINSSLSLFELDYQVSICSLIPPATAISKTQDRAGTSVWWKLPFSIFFIIYYVQSAIINKV